MNKLVAWVLLFLLSCPSIAQTTDPCGVALTAPAINYTDAFLDKTKATCVPAPFGPGTVPSVRANKYGMMAWMYCPVSTGGWSLSWVAGTWSGMTGIDLVSSTAAIAASTDPLASLNSILASNIKTPMSDPALAKVWCPYSKEMQTGAPAPVAVAASAPSVVKWVVTPSGTSTTKSTYSYTGNVRSKIASGTKVPVGSACDCSQKQFVESPVIYCWVQTNLVASCVPKS
jgi:hypothetical protein